MNTGLLIKKLREERNITQEELATALGYSHKSSINKIESGKADISKTKLLKIAEFFNVSPSFLITGETLEAKFNKMFECEKLSKEVKLFENIEKLYGRKIADFLNDFMSLNTLGQEKVEDYITDLLALKRYKSEQKIAEEIQQEETAEYTRELQYKYNKQIQEQKE